jgi:hypothetical protein
MSNLTHFAENVKQFFSAEIKLLTTAPRLWFALRYPPVSVGTFTVTIRILQFLAHNPKGHALLILILHKLNLF